MFIIFFEKSKILKKVCVVGNISEFCLNWNISMWNGWICNCLLIFLNYLVSKNCFPLSDIQSFLTILILLTNEYVNTIYLENKNFSNFCMTEILIVFTFNSNLVCHITSAFNNGFEIFFEGALFFECIGIWHS